jgi:hypothetical protein
VTTLYSCLDEVRRNAKSRAGLMKSVESDVWPEALRNKAGVTIKLAMYTLLGMAVLASPHPAWAGCHFWSLADGSIDSDKDISGEPNGRPLVRFYLVCHDTLVDIPSLNPDLGSDAQSIPANVPLMVAAHGGNGNLLSFKKGNDLTAMESRYLMIYPQGVCDGDSGGSVVSAQRQTQTFNILPGNWPRNIVTSCTEDLVQTSAPFERPDTPNAALNTLAMQSKFEWRSVKAIDGDPADAEYVRFCVGGIGSPCGFRLDNYNIPVIGMGVDARYAESDQYAYRDLRTIARIVERVKGAYYPPNAMPKKRFLGFSSGAGLGLTILKYRHDLFDAYALAGHPVSIRFVQAEQTTPVGPANPYYDFNHFTNLFFGGYPTNIGGPEGTIATNSFDLSDVGDWHDPVNMGVSNGILLGNLNPAGINKKVLFVQGSMDMANLMRIALQDPANNQSAGYGQPNAGDALPTPAGCGTTLGNSTSTAFVWQRYVNHTAQFLDATAGALTPAILDQLSCSNSGWTSVPAAPVLTPTSTLATCGDFGYNPATCGGDLVSTNYVYEFGGGRIKMIIPATGGHSFPKVMGVAAGSLGVNKGNEIRDFSLAQEACIWFGDGCTRTVGY